MNDYSDFIDELFRGQNIPLLLTWVLIRILILAGVTWLLVFLLTRPSFKKMSLPLLVSSVTCIIFGALSIFLLSQLASSQSYGWFAIALIPLGAGMLFTALLWPQLGPQQDKQALSAKTFLVLGLLAPSILALCVSLILFGLFLEGTICVLMALPFLVIFMTIGSLLATTTLYVWHWQQKQTLSCSLIIIAAAIALQPLENNVMVKSEHYAQTSIIDIQAPPEKVFSYIPAFPEIQASESNPHWGQFWFTIGLPEPQQSTVTCHEAGCLRKCRFNQHIYFDEKITHYVPGKHLAFDVKSVVGQQNIVTGVDPHVLPSGIYFDNHKGEFVLEEIRPGVTRIKGTTYYRLKSSMNWYARPYADGLLHAIHMRVLNHIKTLAETEAAGA